MPADVCPGRRAMVVLWVAAALAVPSPAIAQNVPETFKVAFLNIQAGKGERALSGHPVQFAGTSNCTDTSQPLNAWGIGLVQRHLVRSVGSDPGVIALGLAESWATVCGSPENVRKALGWKSRTSERNGVAMVAKFGFAGPEEWQQLDTTLNTNPADTMWVLRIPVCLDQACAKNMDMFVSHWFGAGANKNTSYYRQAEGTVAFLARTAGTRPHFLIGDLNVWDGILAVCSQQPNNIGLQRLRSAGYVDAWPLLHGKSEGYTGMTNRRGCGSPVGYAWKRPDYSWAPANFLPLSIERFGMVPPGAGAPSDHYGLITEFPLPRASSSP